MTFLLMLFQSLELSPCDLEATQMETIETVLAQPFVFLLVCETNQYDHFTNKMERLKTFSFAFYWQYNYLRSFATTRSPLAKTTCECDLI